MIVAGRNGVMYERKAVYVVCYRVRNFVRLYLTKEIGACDG